jgi:hypothetical protein
MHALTHCTYDRSSAVKRSSTTAAATHRNHDNGDASDGADDRDNNYSSAASSVHSNVSDVLGGVRYVQLYEVRTATSVAHVRYIISANAVYITMMRNT